jgi:hypothetical protein
MRERAISREGSSERGRGTPVKRAKWHLGILVFSNIYLKKYYLTLKFCFNKIFGVYI